MIAGGDLKFPGKHMRKWRKTLDEEMYQTILIWEFFNFSTEGFFVEVGANDPRCLSVTWLLERVGWRGILVEPLPDKSEALRKARPGSKVCEVAVSSEENAGEADFHVQGTLSSLRRNIKDVQTTYDSVIRVKVVTLDSLLEESEVPGLDLVSIDTEGTEYDVLRGFDVDKHKPSLILLEDVVHTLQVHDYLRKMGYRLFRRTGFNNWYVPMCSGRKTPAFEKWKLFRKMYVGTPWRAFKFKRRQKKRAKDGS